MGGAPVALGAVIDLDILLYDRVIHDRELKSLTREWLKGFCACSPAEVDLITLPMALR